MSNLNKNYLQKKFNDNIYKESITTLTNSSDEIIKLERQFRNAYMLKSLEAQMAEKEANKIAQSVQDKLQIDLIAYENRKAIENDLKKASQIKKDRQECVEYLRKQILLREEMALAEEERLKEERRKLEDADEEVERMEEVQKREKREFLARKFKYEKQIREEIREILEVKQQEEEAEARERDRIYQENLNLRVKEWKEVLEDKKNAREEMIRKVCELLEGRIIDKSQELKREEIICELMAEDIKRELIVKEYEDLLLKREKKAKLSKDLKAQVLLNVQLEDQAIKRETLLAEQVIKRVMEEDYLARLTDQARKRKQRQYKEDLEKFIEDARRIRREIVIRAQEEFESAVRVQRELSQKKIEDHHRRLIDRHALNVAAYLRNGILGREIREYMN
ncbi:trichohyalin-like [Cotesia glomerata]|uniref:trichohyalin-like n=1 Tax=Cotesia glomerata TaxID=32391 RepID=UPI001D032868|nr:trichohyalin-like [Cotesia glomerata]